MNSGTKQLVLDVVRSKCHAKEAFTAFDISREVQRLQEANKLPIERHRNMKNDVHILIADIIVLGPYTKTLMDVGAQQDAWVYHDSNVDPHVTYQPLDRSQLNAPQPVVPVAPVANGTLVDARGTLCVPVEHLRAINVGPGDLVSVISENGNMYVVKDSVLLNKIAEYTADTYGNVRITSKTLTSVFNNANSYNFSVQNDRIQILS